MSDISDTPAETPQEYFVDAIVHAVSVGFVLMAVISLALLVPETFSLTSKLAITVYCVGLIMTFGFSAAYNLTKRPHIKTLLRRLDHGAIFVMIAGTYTPIMLIGIGGLLGVAFVSVVWGIALIGIVLKLFFPVSNKWFSIALYLGQAWVAVFAIIPLYEALSSYAFAMMVLGGVIYSSGVYIYRKKAWPFNRAIWHGFMLVASALHFTMVLDVIGAL